MSDAAQNHAPTCLSHTRLHEHSSILIKFWTRRF